MNCEGCSLRNNCASPQMIYNGCKNPKVLFVVESPTEEEDSKGVLFYGKRYKYIKSFLGDVSEGEIGFISLIGCYKNSKYTAKDFVKCNSNFLEVFTEVIPSVKVIFALGGKVYKTLLGDKFSVTNVGKVYKVRDVYCIPIEDPIGKLNSKTKDRMKSAINKGLRLAFSEVISPSLLGRSITADEFDKILPRILKANSVVFDCETTGLDAFEEGTYLIGVGFYWGEESGIFIPIQHKDLKSSFNDRQRKIDNIKKIMYDSRLKKKAYNGGFDLTWMSVHLGVDIDEVKNYDFDVFHGYHMFSETEFPSLTSLIDNWVPEMLGYDSLVDTDWQQYKNMGKFPLTHIAPYCVGDCMATYKIGKKLSLELQKQNSYDLFTEIVMPALKVYTKMSNNGINLDLNYRRFIEEKYTSYLGKIYSSLLGSEGNKLWMEKFGEEINPNSSNQIGKLLYDLWGIEELKTKRKDKVTRKVTFTRSVDKKSLLYLLSMPLKEGQKEFIKLLVQHSLINSPLTTFISAAESWLHDDGLIHPNFNVSGTVTGRLSSSSPNGQNFPSKVPTVDEEVAEFMSKFPTKKMFISKFKNGKLVEADFSQLELRLMAILSNDIEMVGTYKYGLNNGDIHLTAAKKLFANFDEQTDEVKAAWRKIAKQKNFEGAYSFDPAFLEMYPGLGKYVKHIEQIVRSQGWIANKLGRIRHLPQIKNIKVPEGKFFRYNEDVAYLNSLLRQAVNFTVQSLGHDFLEKVVVKVNDRLLREGMRAHLCLEVHDSLVCDSPEEEAEKCALILKEEMESITEDYDWISVPLLADVGIGDNLAEITKIKFE